VVVVWCAALEDYLTVRSRAFEALCHMLRLALRRLAKHQRRRL
jgi:hypothetical protein